ncbi:MULTISPECIES: DUF3775 domain-containing protein [Ensifer]|uniref:DUF3775 domain-containing protein n=1 Tax=Ensifer TaxID=106591 RepID=UPI000DC1FE89|nr:MULTISPECIES: DUF3775 domain-containing protein [Ensifer]MCY1746301.1 DUF3775 domain-containing protein [Ensifer sp. SL37]RAS08297.1 uncharacterized protein DUF3775 [Ensifer adhaerens]
MSATWNLSISPDSVCYLIIKAREFDAKDVVSEIGPASNATDDGMIAVLEDQPDDPVESELESTISAMNEDEQIDLVALCWLGRGDDTVEDWERIRAEAAAAHNQHTAAYLIGTPLLADYLEEAMAEFGESCQDYERGHL